MLKWLSNEINPKSPYLKNSVPRFSGQTQEDAMASYNEWLKDKIIGLPKQVNESVTVGQLIASGMVGIYKEVEE